jgi:hypothetical protein
MHRHTLPVLLSSTVLAIACGPYIGEPQLNRQGTLHQETNGVVLYEERKGGIGGMMGTTCEFDGEASLGQDVSVNGASQPEILDGDKGDQGAVVLARTAGTLHLLGTSGWSSWLQVQESVDFPGIDSAFFTQDGVVGLGGCTLRWFSSVPSNRKTVDLQDDNCQDATMSVSRATGDAFVTAGGEVQRIGLSSHAPLGHRADRVLFSDDLDGLALFDDESSELRFVTASGELLWSMDVDPTGRASIDSIADLGARGALAVTTGGARPELLIIDGFTGEELRRTAMPSAAEVVAASDARSLALVRRNQVDLFNVR